MRDYAPSSFAIEVVPDARSMDIPKHELSAEVTLLVRSIIQWARGPKLEEPKLSQIAALIGVTEYSLKAWRRPHRKLRNRRKLARTGVRNIQFPALYCLRVLAANPEKTAKAIWGAQE